MWAFKNCSSLQELSDFSQVSSIRTEAFQNSGLQHVPAFPKLKYMGDSAFLNCPLEEFTLPFDLKDISLKAFKGTNARLKVPKICKLNNGNDSVPVRLDIDNNTLIITQSKQWKKTEEYCEILANRIFDKIIIQLQDFKTGGAVPHPFFQGKVIEIKDAYNSIPDSWQKNSKNLKTVLLPKSVTKIGNNAFQNCQNLEQINLHNIRNIGSHCFSTCSKIHFSDLNNLETIDSYALNNTNDVSFETGHIKEIGKKAFENSTCSQLDFSNVSKIEVQALEKASIDTLILPNHTIQFICENPITEPTEAPKIQKLILPEVIEGKNGKYYKFLIEGSDVTVMLATIEDFQQGTRLVLDSKALGNITKIIFCDDVFEYFWFLFPNLHHIDLKETSVIPLQNFSNCQNIKTMVLSKKIVNLDNDFNNIWNLDKLYIPEVIEILDQKNNPWFFSITLDNHNLVLEPYIPEIQENSSEAPPTTENLLMPPALKNQKFSSLNTQKNMNSQKILTNTEQNNLIEINPNEILRIEFIWNEDFSKEYNEEENYPVCLWLCNLFNNLKTIIIDPIVPSFNGTINNHIKVREIQTNSQINLGKKFANNLQIVCYNADSCIWNFPQFSEPYHKKTFKDCQEVKENIRKRINDNKGNICENLDQILNTLERFSFYSTYYSNICLKDASKFRITPSDLIKFNKILKNYIETKQISTNNISTLNLESIVEDLEKNYQQILLTLLSTNAPVFIKSFLDKLTDDEVEMSVPVYCLAIAVRMHYGLPWKDVLSGCSDNFVSKIQFVIHKFLPSFFSFYLDISGKENLWNFLIQDDVDNVQEIFTRNNFDGQNFPKFFFQSKQIYLSLLHIAALFGSLKCFKYLLLNNFVENLDEDQKNALMQCSILGNNIEIIRVVNQIFPDIIKNTDIMKNTKDTLKSVAALLLDKGLIDWIETTGN